MNRYLTFRSTNFGHQTIARNAYNQTFVWQTTYIGVANSSLPSAASQRLRSDLNYQLGVL